MKYVHIKCKAIKINTRTCNTRPEWKYEVIGSASMRHGFNTLWLEEYNNVSVKIVEELIS
jgi:hypothetical protein